MKRALYGLLLCIAFMIGIPASSDSASAISKIYGLAGECNLSYAGCTPIPTTVTMICTVGCPQAATPSLTDANRMWGRSSGAAGACRTSTDGGATWAACTTQPFVGGTWQGREQYVGTGDGGVIALSFDTTPTCMIRKSIDNAATWTTVFTSAERCAGPQYETSSGWCLEDGRCEIQSHHSSAVPAYATYRSSDDGDTWIKGADTGVDTVRVPAGSVWNGTVGLMPLTQTDIGGATYSNLGSGSWGVGVSTGSGFGDCWGQAIIGGVPYAMCANGTVYTLRSSTGTLFKTPTFSSSVLFTIDSGGVSLGYNSTVVYTLISSTTGSKIFVSKDSGSTFTYIGNATSGNLRGGVMWVHPINACVYFNAGGTLYIGKICI